MLCFYKLMVACLILHKPREITWMRDRRLKWGSVDAAAQLRQSVILSTETVQRITLGKLQAARVSTAPQLA